MNKNELILDKVRSLTYHELGTGKMLLRRTSLEDPSLACTAEGEEVTDAVGALITTLYRAKRATISGTNSLISLDLAAAQYGTQKEVATAEKKITDYTYEILTPDATSHKITLAHEPIGEIKYIYLLTDGEVAQTYEAAAEAGDGKFVHASGSKEITLGENATGKFYIEYKYESTDGVRVANMASNFPEAGSLIVYAYFRDKCNENVVYSGKIVAAKAKLNPENVELALTSTGKHPFEFVINKDSCAEDGEDELFSIIFTSD